MYACATQCLVCHEYVVHRMAEDLPAQKFVSVQYNIITASSGSRIQRKTTIPLPRCGHDKFLTIGKFVKSRAIQISKHGKRLLTDGNPGEDGFKESKEAADEAVIRVVSVTQFLDGMEVCLDDDHAIDSNMTIWIRIKSDQEIVEEQKDEAKGCDKEYKKEDYWHGCEVCGLKKAYYKPGTLCTSCQGDEAYHRTQTCDKGDDCRLCAWYECPKMCGDHFKETGCPVCDIIRSSD
jgi:hypothetical protein